ncbi:hypothetical protein CHO01_27370 [Cellulomonas hominis]|uniref:CD-NTase-associated protein 12/Pycsar effector protein TIR domain-containing protein n=1 Tax=Cellulomonas hominis TaxID=156981 RepID=A0A511FEF2_9CELL|nr:nucleotide-binding protein [Cellulomonas hominis]MBB5472849.1 hypothetical protein [Cellulomonas hominis]NKY05773.1 nucleotide-binding protein [Cellulomonas hominis]GEL47621.1 hypothetical protein CHO01_27370 [Cellulomonas hominis]
MTKPAVFIGSSTEALDVARHFQIALEGVFECEATVWDQDVFTPGLYAMEALVEQAESSDFAVLLVTPDDLVEARGQITPAPRDNVLFETGLFMGALGVRRVFLLCPNGVDRLKLPSDLLGLNRLPNYTLRDDANVTAAMARPAMSAKKTMARLGPRPARAPIPVVASAPSALEAQPFPRHGLDQMFAGSRPGRFAHANQNRTSVHLRAVWRPTSPTGVPGRLADPRAFPALTPTSLLDVWHDYYASNGGVGGTQPSWLDAVATNDTCFVAHQDLARAVGAAPEASVRAAVALLDGEPSLRFVADVSLSVPGAPLPLHLVLRSLAALARHATRDLPQWLARDLPGPLPDEGVLELHAQGRGAMRGAGTRDSLEEYIDLNLLGQRSKVSPIAVSQAVPVDLLDDQAINNAITSAFGNSTTNWGYFEPPADLVSLLAVLMSNSRP